MFLTPGELTLLAPLVGAPVGAVIAFIASRRTSKDNLRGQIAVVESTEKVQRELAKDKAAADRRIESDKRLWDERRNLYLELLERLKELTDLLSSLTSLSKVGVGEADRTHETLSEMAAKTLEILDLKQPIDLFAHDAVREVYLRQLRTLGEFYASWTSLAHLIMHFPHSETESMIEMNSDLIVEGTAKIREQRLTFESMTMELRNVVRSSFTD